MSDEIAPAIERIGADIVQSCLQVHRSLGLGLLEAAYEACLAHELKKRNRTVARQVHLPIVYDGQRIESAFKLDLLVDDEVIVELKSVDQMNPIFEAQILTYLRLAHKRLGFLVNFNVRLIKHGIKRYVV